LLPIIALAADANAAGGRCRVIVFEATLSDAVTTWGLEEVLLGVCAKKKEAKQSLTSRAEATFSDRPQRFVRHLSRL
jgi:hypothetical protein